MGKIGLGCVVILVILVLVVGISLAGTYNRLVTLGQEVDKQWSQVENQYQRRADLVPNLVATVQGAAQFEKSTLEAVTQARASVGRAQINPGAAPTDPAQLAQYEQAQAALGARCSASRRRREVPGAEGQRQLPRPAGAARRDGEPHRRGANGLQRRRSGLQHGAAAVPDQPDGRDVRFQGEGLLQGDGRIG